MTASGSRDDDIAGPWLQAEVDDLEIDSETGVTRWRGERIDWALAVGHLFDNYN